MDVANDDCDDEENEEGIADIVPGVEVEEDAGTIQLPEESRPINFYPLDVLGTLSPHNMSPIKIQFEHKSLRDDLL